MDEFANLPDDDEFASLPDDNSTPGNIDRSENILQRALSISGKAGQAAFKALTPDSSTSMVPGLNLYQAGHAAKSSFMEDVAGENAFGGTALDIISDPETYIGIGIAGKASKKIPRLLRTPEVEREVTRENLFKRMVGRRKAMVKQYGSSLDKSYGVVDISDIQKELGLDPSGPISMKEAQEFKNKLSQVIPEAIKSGKKISSKFSNVSEAAGEITNRMIKADPKIEPIIKKYGELSEAYKTSIGQFSPSTRGSETIYGKPGVMGIKDPFLGGTGSRVATEKFAPRIFKQAKSVRMKENLKRFNEAAAIGVPLTYVAKNIVPGIFHQVFRRASESV